MSKVFNTLNEEEIAQVEELRTALLNAQAREARLREALVRSRIAIDDWLNVYASDMCDEARVKEALNRINEKGTLAYISDIQQENGKALSTPFDHSALEAHDSEVIERCAKVCESFGPTLANGALLTEAIRALIAVPEGCSHCNHPLFAAMRCGNCGKVFETEEGEKNG